MGLIKVNGACKYCGQFVVMDVPENWTTDQIEEEATRKCTCEKAKAEMLIEDIISTSVYNLKEMFKDNEDLKVMRDMALVMVEPLSRKRLDKVSMSHGNYALSMKRKTAKISISLKYTDEDKRE